MPAILILGGTGEARQLAERLVAHGGVDVTLSLAGRTANPLPQAGRLRVGGFGGVEGLVRHLRERVDVLVDATHPYAARMSGNAEIAAREAGVPLVVLERPAWQPASGDNWIAADSAVDAAARLGEAPRTVFLAIGRQELAPFRALPWHRYVVRSVDPVGADQAIPGAVCLLERGPFDLESERRLLVEHRIDVVVSKNSGGEAALPKIVAARALGLPVVMIMRPRPRPSGAVSTVDEALGRILHVVGPAAKRGE